MALLRRDLCRQIKGPEVTHADCCTLVFDTDAKTLYVEREVAHVDVHDGMTEIQTTTMDIGLRMCRTTILREFESDAMDTKRRRKAYT